MGRRKNKKGSLSADFAAEDSDSSLTSNRSSPHYGDDSIEMIKTGSQLSQMSNPELDDQINSILDGMTEKASRFNNYLLVFVNNRLPSWFPSCRITFMGIHQIWAQNLLQCSRNP